MSDWFSPPEWKPHDYQVRGVEWLTLHLEGGLCFAPGLGKTSVTLATICKFKELGYNFKFLVIAPLRVCQSTWLTEPHKWAQFTHLKIGLAHGVDKQEILLSKNYDIVVINYDAIPWMCEQFATHGNPFDGVIFDEITKLKHTNTQRFKRLKKFLHTFNIRWGLTGTPAANGLLDLFGQMFCLDLGARLGKYVTHYRANYFHQKPHDQYSWYITDEHAEQIHKRVGEILMYIRPEEVLKLPDLIHIDLPVSLPTDVLKQYKMMEATAIAELRGGILMAANAGVVAAKLRQITSGMIYTNAERDVEQLHTAKLDALDDLIEEQAGEPLMVAYNFNHERLAIQKRHPNALAIYGGMGDMSKVLGAWNTRQCPLLLVQPTAGAHGLNLQFGGSALCWYSQTYNLEEYIQLIARLYRQGQTDIVRVYHILADKTIDHHMRKILADKNQTQESLFVSLCHILLQNS